MYMRSAEFAGVPAGGDIPGASGKGRAEDRPPLARGQRCSRASDVLVP